MATLAATNEQARVVKRPGSSKNKLVSLSSTEGTCCSLDALSDRFEPVELVFHYPPQSGCCGVIDLASELLIFCATEYVHIKGKIDISL